MNRVVYRELSSLEKDLGISAKRLYTISNSLSRHYLKVILPKKNGGARLLSVPDDNLKTVQRRISDVLLSHMPVSPFARAYTPGASPLKNAIPHIGKDWIINSYFILQLKDVIKTAMPFGYSDGTLYSLGLVEEDE
ncbi:MAG: hypothetical protein J5562_06690 [Clostridia bacterium]|nr:hypothetical protein [Clostridia bacterium]